MTILRTCLFPAAAIILPCAGCAGGTAALPETASVAGGAVSAPEDMSCKKLAGLVQVRLLQLRDYDERNRSSATSRVIQSASVSAFGGSKKGIDVDAEHAADMQSLRTYNDQLKEKGCKSFDLDKELSIHDAGSTPAATIAPPKQPAVRQSQD